MLRHNFVPAIEVNRLQCLQIESTCVLVIAQGGDRCISFFDMSRLQPRDRPQPADFSNAQPRDLSCKSTFSDSQHYVLLGWASGSKVSRQ